VQGRVWIVVGVFAGVAVMLGAWMLLSNEPATEAARERVPDGRPRVGKIERKLEVPPERVRQLAVERHLPRGAGGDAPGAPAVGSSARVFPLDESGVKAAVAARIEDLEACYETALFHTPGLSGKMTLSLEIEPAPGQVWGTVRRVDTDSDLDATVFEGCVATVFEELRFAAPEPATLRYPIVFEADDDDEGREAAEDAPAGGTP